MTTFKDKTYVINLDTYSRYIDGKRYPAIDGYIDLDGCERDFAHSTDEYGEEIPPMEFKSKEAAEAYLDEIYGDEYRDHIRYCSILETQPNYD